MIRTMIRGAKESGGFSRSRGGRLLPKRKRFPVGGCAHAAKDERRCRLEQGAAAFLPLRFGAYDAHAVGTERKNREGRSVGEARLAVEAFHERRKARVGAGIYRVTLHCHSKLPQYVLVIPLRCGRCDTASVLSQAILRADSPLFCCGFGRLSRC